MHLIRLFVLTLALGAACRPAVTEESQPAATDGGKESAKQPTLTASADSEDAERGDAQDVALRRSFVRQIEVTPAVRELVWDDPEITFTGPDGSGGTARPGE